jgi:putative holliday junction resolvase
MAVISSPFDLPTGRLLALDLGQARHGVAVCDQTGTLATPLTILRRHCTRSADFIEIQALVDRHAAKGVLVGLPLQTQDHPAGQARWVQRYAGRLASMLSVPVAFWDESLSSHEAASLMRRHPREPLDDVAAALVLQDFLEARRLLTQAEGG